MAYFITGAPGIILATVIFFTLKEPMRKSISPTNRNDEISNSAHASQDESLLAPPSADEKTMNANEQGY